MDLLQQLQRDRELMLAAVTEAKIRGIKLAQAEANYQTAKHNRVLQLKDEGHSATMIQLIIKGDEAVSLPLFERDCAQVEYDSAIEAINAYKLSARLIEDQIKREWNQSGGVV